MAKNSKTNGASYSFEYSAVNQLKKTTILAAPLSPIVQKIIEYKYDPVGRRIQRKVTDNIDSTKSNTKKYYYDGENILAETDDQNNVTASYTHSPLCPDDILSANFTDYAVSQSKGGMAINEGQVLADNKNSIYYLKDHLNTVTDIIGAGGNIIQKFDYTAYGTIRSVKNNLNQYVGFDNAAVRTSFTYTGREYEQETGMYYYRARYYDPNTGRFLQTDPDPGKLGDPKTFLSKYIYAANSPVMFTDPSGRNALGLIISVAAIIGATVVFGFPALIGIGIAGLLSSLVTGLSTGDWSAGNLLNAFVLGAGGVALSSLAGFGAAALEEAWV